MRRSVRERFMYFWPDQSSTGEVLMWAATLTSRGAWRGVFLRTERSVLDGSCGTDGTGVSTPQHCRMLFHQETLI